MRHVAVVSYHSSPLHEPGAGDAGGMTVYVRAVAEALARRGIRTDIFTRSKHDGTVVDHISPAVRVVSIGIGPDQTLEKDATVRHIDRFVTEARSFAISHRLAYDVIHSHYWQSGLAGLHLARTWGAPLVHSHHTLARVKNGSLAPGDEPEPPTRITGEERVITNADVLIASTEQEWSQIAHLYQGPRDRIKTIFPGVDHGLFFPGDRAAARAELGVPPDAAVLLYVGRIQPLKGLDLALRALEELAPALDRDLYLLVVGGPSGPRGTAEERRLEWLARRLGLGDRVRFLGPKPHPTTPLYYRAADLVAVCSYSESFGLSALEAHACGIPVIATDVGALAHIVRDGRSGFLIDDRDPSIFAARAKTVLSDPRLWHEFSTEAISSAAGFAWERTAEELLELYECLLTERFPEACTC